jgi:hypothetical protein
VVGYVSGQSNNVEEVWVRKDAGSWVDITGGATSFYSVSGSFSFEFRSSADNWNNHGSVVVTITPFGTQARHFGWQTCEVD